VKTILAPIDLSPVTKWVVAEAAHLAQELRGRLVLLNVTQPETLVEDEVAFRNTIAYFEEHPLEMEATGTISGLDHSLDDEPVSGDSLQLIGEPVPVILEQADKLGADYIVIGLHGRSTLHDLVFGSVTAGVLKDAKCPVVVVAEQRGQMLAHLRRTLARQVDIAPSLAAQRPDRGGESPARK